MNQIRSDSGHCIRLNRLLIHFLRGYKTHYETLNVRRNCTDKEIKAAFIKLSKENHPDTTTKNKKEAHNKFQEINEAHRVLSKAESRRMYDLGLSNESGSKFTRHHRHRYYSNPYDNPLFWANRDRTRDHYYNNRPYYGVHGVNRISNGLVVMWCFFVVSLGIGLQFVAINKSMTFKRDDMIRRSKEAQKTLDDTQELANCNGNETQLKILEYKLLGTLMAEQQED